MQARWVRHNGSAQVILFMNGCGMDERVVARMAQPAGRDMLMVFNYTDLGVPDAVHDLLDSGATITLVAWSMGVWAAGALADKMERISGSVAVNGTASPLNDLYGIPPVLYRATVAGFSEENCRSFYRRMCGTADNLRRFLESAPDRSLADQHAELAAIETLAAAPTALPAFPFRSAIVASQDRIIPTANMQRFWAEHGGCRTVDMPHYPFFHLSWEELIADAAGR